MILTRKNGIVREWKINQVGWPYHGLVTDDALEYKSGSTVDYPAQSYPMWHKFQGNRRNAPVRDETQQTADASAGRQWLDYAIIAGEDAVVCGQELGVGRFLYSDANGNNWLMRVESSQNNTAATYTVRLILETLFGRFDGNTYPTVDKVLATYTGAWADDGPPGFYGDPTPMADQDIDSDFARYWMLEPNLTGSAGYLNLTTNYTTNCPYITFYQFAQYSYGAAQPNHTSSVRTLFRVLAFSITGKGVIHERADLLGRNITATLTTHKDWDGIYTSSSTEKNLIYRVYADGTELACHGEYEDTASSSWSRFTIRLGEDELVESEQTITGTIVPREFTVNGSTYTEGDEDYYASVGLCFRSNRTFWVDAVNNPPVSGVTTAHYPQKAGITDATAAVVATHETGDYSASDSPWTIIATTADRIAFDPVGETFARDDYLSPVYWT